MSGLLPHGDLAHTVFISCQMLFLIILSFPVVLPPRPHRPPHLLPLAPCLSPRGSENPIPFKSPYSSSPSAPFFVLILISLLGAAPTLFTPAALWWLPCLGKVRRGENVSILVHFVEPLHDVTIRPLYSSLTEEAMLTWKTWPRTKHSRETTSSMLIIV